MIKKFYQYPKSRRAFTLIELLVVIAIIAILAAILFPVFAQAKESAKKATCLSNIKQAVLGLVMYGNDYDDVRPGYYQYVEGPGIGQAWCIQETRDASYMVTAVDASKGYVQPYTKNAQIFDCLAAQGMPAAYYYLNGALPIAIGFNENGGGEISEIESLSETILLADAGVSQPPTSSSSVTTRTLLVTVPGSGEQHLLHGRHSGETANIGWCDGHAKSSKVSYVPYDSAPDFTAADLKRMKLGDVLKYPRKKITDTYDYVNDPFDADTYYYVKTKPKL